ncbi:B12-binding domain-containing radical SAM protein [Streptomyces sp. UNOC14_S4]|uniref:B12-binding domain-containing radical SAM protein n=1 Tax=Streptomyces sp. UNOC14_S4 TaxID=2872340 RepID=UPI001E4B6C32|nr:radical SAM protein [Streptomyces sp. UNOC14_S4]MCC3769582.1 B12-binding domain-containing radical SAM protein [Streptomyces sp. UNOC14_S4]
MSVLDRRPRDPRVLCLYPPLQYYPDEVYRPDCSLALPYLHAALRAAGFDADLLDTSIGRPGRDRLEDTFYRKEPMPELGKDLFRIGLRPERILEEVEAFDVVAVSSIFTQQTACCLDLARLVKSAFPEKILVAGGVNARSLKEMFFDSGYDVVFLSEGEEPLVAFAEHLRSGTPALDAVPSISFRRDGRTVTTRGTRLVTDLDEYPMPSWDALPNEQYWDISVLWGGREGWMDEGQKPHFASILTSRGCPYRCTYCHISKERGGEAGEIGDLRFHSVERVERELDTLKGLGVDLVYINDDSLLAWKHRVHQVLDLMRRYDFELADINGVNIRHLFRRDGRSDRLVVDVELLEHLHAAGFRRIGLPFESGSQRVLDAYSTSKWRLDKCDVLELVRVMRAMGFTINGNFMVGYPDETVEELTRTFWLARRAMDAGLHGCGFFMVQPFPGTAIYDQAVANGQLDPAVRPDDMGFSKAQSPSPFRNLKIDPQVLHYARNLAYALLNRDQRSWLRLSEGAAG